MRVRKRTTVILAAGTAIALTATVGVVVWQSQAPSTSPSDTAQEVAGQRETVPVVKGTLTDRVRLNAILGYGAALELPATSEVITRLPKAGKVIRVGSPVYEAEGRPVVLFRGKRPFWRDLTIGMSDGQDVQQLERNLSRLGFFDRDPDSRFDTWTDDAVKRWQKSLGLAASGTVAASDIVTVDAPSLRVAQVTGKLGQSQASPLSYTATRLSAVARLSAAQARELQVGTPVTVVLPDGAEVASKIAEVDPGGQPTDEEGKTTPPTAVIEFADQKQVAAAGPSSVRVLVQQSEESRETLIVPATALIATARDEYAVEVRRKEKLLRIPVTIGLIADARVQILASGPEASDGVSASPALAEGDEVVIS